VVDIGNNGKAQGHQGLRCEMGARRQGGGGPRSCQLLAKEIAPARKSRT